ncbi:cubilin-like [Acanthaster planci]|uniref:Cubilin-like n=1 Tax=Acanthaster planci TaxID=133434 RepID=A0A8B7Y9Z1_ACAPL|nr:cubilin-like [Acanthaster planci]
MGWSAGPSVALWLGVAVGFLFLCTLGVKGQTHQWKNRYSSCSAQCGGGVQFLEKKCFTTDQIPKPALPSFCSGIPIREKDVISCNTFPCGTCKRTYNSQSGTITSPHYPDKYSIPRYCQLFISLPAGNRVLLGFSEFVLEGLNLAAFAELTESSVCLCGTLVQITDKEKDGRSSTYCGTKQPFSWLSDSNSVLLEFVTESSHLFNRFKAHYKGIPAKPSCYDRRDLAAVGKGYVRSPGHPNKYGSGLDCEYILHADPSNGIVLTLLEFQLEPSPDCDLDYLSIEDMYSRRKQVFCGSLGDASWTSDSNEVRLTFHSSANDAYKGFVILYETENRAPRGSQFFMDPEGTITSPGYPLMYPPNTQAHYLIYAQPDRIVVVKFDEFQLEREDQQGQPIPVPRQRRSTLDVLQFEDGLPCVNADHVEILDKLEGTSSYYCGKLPPFTWFSQTNEVILRFVSDADENYKGFHATYRTIEKRPASEWELVFRAASDKETGVVRKWLDTSRGYSEWDIKAKSIFKKDSPRTFKSRKVNDWENLAVRKVKIELYKAGSAVSSFHFVNHDKVDDIISWFACDHLIYASYDDLLHIDCSNLKFSTTDNFAITDNLGSSGFTCNNDTARLWLDVQDRIPSPLSPAVCPYERSARDVAQFFYSIASEAGLTATGTNIATADVMTIWIQRDCDQTFTDIPSGTVEKFESEGFSLGRDYPNNEYCNYYFLNGPYDRFLLHFTEFSLEHEDNVCTKDYVEIEDLTTGHTERFCGNQRHPLFTSAGNTAVVRFRTNSHSTFPGWAAEASIEGRNNEDCSSIVTASSGNLTNADYPSPLTHFRLQGCETLLHGHVADRVTASFNSVIVDLEDCPELTIIDHVSATPIIEVSGKVLPFSWTSISNELILWYCASLPYRSYLFYEGNFKATMSPSPATCVQYLDAEFPGTFDWPSTSLVTGQRNCYIVIRTQPVLNQRIILTIRNLVLKDKDCHSYMKVTDTTTERSDTTCQTAQQPFTWTSDANEVIVQFISGNSFSIHTVDGHYASAPRPKLDESQTFTGMAGLFTSPNYPEDYPSNLRMDYLLHGKAHEIVFVNFVELNLEMPSTTPLASPRSKRHVLYKRQAVTITQTACEYDFIEIKDNLDTTRNVRYCGNQLPFSWVSSGNEAMVTFITDGSVVKKGFKAEYIFQQRPDPTGCGGIFEASSGAFDSPGYPGIYPRNSDCTYIILALANQRVKLTFTSFNTESDDECEKDNVEVTDKLTQKADRYCGNLATPFSWTSDSNLVFVVFHSDSQRQYGGFTVEYETEDRPEKTVCQYNFNDQSGEIQSPTSSSHYPNLRECNYVITVEPGYGIHLVFVEFVLEGPAPSGKCEYDYVQIEDAVSGTSDKLCGTKSPFERLISTNQVKVVFKSDLIVFYKGFRATYEQVDLSTRSDCDKDLTAPSGVFTTPDHPANYPLSKECRFHIVVASDQRVKITFSDFSLEGYQNCPYDFVEVSDVGKNNKEKFCGRKPSAFSWTSETNDVLVFFHSDDRTPSTGFSASYESQPLPIQAAVNTGCYSDYNIILRAGTGKLTSPNYPRDYPLNVDCRMRIELDNEKLCQITFTDFELEDETNCGYDYLQLTSIPDGDTVAYCGQQTTPFTWQSKSSTCEVLFHSDEYVPAKGYQAMYASVDSSVQGSAAPAQLAVASACDQQLGGSSGTFTSPNYPGNYPVNTDCTTTIEVADGYRVKIEFQAFDVEWQDRCEWDWVQITDLGTQEATNYCGVYSSGLDHTSTTNMVSVLLHSDSWVPRPGYSAKFTALLQ